jgi:HKD family nuclease
MIIRTISQPETQLGNEISDLLNSEAEFSHIVFVSAFVALRAILRLRERLLMHVEGGADLLFTIGIDLGGTSREVLQELLRWNCRTFIFHNTIARSTFHPKIYLFETSARANVFIGSNNLTDGGFYTNYEAATHWEFDLPRDAAEYNSLLKTLDQFLNPKGLLVRQLDADLIQTLIARGELPSETEARQNAINRTQGHRTDGAIVPANPFSPVAVPYPPLLPGKLRQEEQVEPQAPEAPEQPAPPPAVPQRHQGVLVWRKILTKSDALQVREGTAHVGGVRLTQAKFENPLGQRIDQTSYFRRLFADYHWEHESGRHRDQDQEHTFVPMHIVIRGIDYVIHNFEISHKPSGEAGQDNYTTILRWGHEFNPIVARENLAETVFSLYETDEEGAAFLIDITDT